MKSNKRKTCGLFFQHLPPYPGAASRRAESIISKLIDNDIIINIYSTTIEYDKDYKNLYHYGFKNLSNENSSHYIIRLVHELFIGFSIMIRLIFFPKHRTDLFFVSSPSYIISLFICFTLILLKRKYIIDVRDIYPDIYVELMIFKPNNFIYRILDRFTKYIYKKALFVSTTNNRISNSIKNYNDKVITVYNGYPEVMLDFNYDKYDKFTVVHHGVLGFFQNIDLLHSIITSPKLENINFHIIGYGIKEDVIRKIHKNNVFFHGKLTLDETLKIISKSHIGLSLRRDNIISRNSFPVKNWEYLGACLPTINYPNTEGAEFVKKNNVGISIAEPKTDFFVEGIINYCNNKSLYNQHKNNARTIRVNYTREKCIKDLCDNILSNL